MRRDQRMMKTALSGLLTGAPTELNDPNDIPNFDMETEYSLKSDTEYPYPEEDFSEDD